MKTLDKYLNEKNDTKEIEGHIKGAKDWLDKIFEMVKYGRMKDAKQTYKNLMKNLKLLDKLIQ